jgi:hypothetical protein
MNVSTAEVQAASPNSYASMSKASMLSGASPQRLGRRHRIFGLGPALSSSSGRVDEVDLVRRGAGRLQPDVERHHVPAFGDMLGDPGSDQPPRTRPAAPRAATSTGRRGWALVLLSGARNVALLCG